MLGLITVVFLGTGCTEVGDPWLVSVDVDSSTTQIDFATSVVPIFQTYGCNGCHGGTAGLDLSSAAAVAAGGNNGPSVESCDASGSLLIARLANCSMPPGDGCLTPAELAIVSQWVDEGATETFVEGTCD